MSSRLRRLGRRLRHPFWGSVAVLVGAWASIVYGIPHVPPLLGVESAPVPSSVVWQYMLTVALAVGLYVSAEEERWRRFREPIWILLGDPDRRALRVAVLLASVTVVGWGTFSAVRPSYGAPPSLRSIHPAPPDRIRFRGETLRLSELRNPLREEGETAEHVRRGAGIYVRNCMPCHGDRLDGDGHFAPAFNPTPIDFTSGGNLPQLSESFVFWRIAKGGPGLPPEATPWNSAMPAWEGVLTEREIWSVILYLYERTGFTPRATGGHGEGGGAEGDHTADRDAESAGAGRILGGAARIAVAPAAAQDSGRGAQIYRRWCRECHGAEGEGDGPAAERMLPRPRDFTAARYQIRTTGSGRLPTDEDLDRVIRDGLPGTTMPGWPGLDRGERVALIAYLKSLSRFFGRGDPPEPVEAGPDPGGGAEALERGREVYRELECYRCHGQSGRGDGESAPTLEDWRDRPVRAAVLTEPWTFNGGSSVEAIHMRFLTGLDGTPMPTQSDALDAGIVSGADLWHLARYVRNLGPERAPPPVRDAVRVRRAGPAEELPEGPEDEAWAEIPRFFFPLAGQIVERPRQFEPTVGGVWVQGAHDGEEIVLRLAWNDPSESPDSAWAEWQQKVAEHMDPDGAPIPTGPLSDRLALQLPVQLPEGRERPYVLMGSPRRPVYLWRWDSRSGVREATATGLRTSSDLEGAELEGSAVWNEGRWTVTFRRSLSPEGDDRISLPTGVPVPVAFFAWDGNSGEDETRGSISSWYFLVLEEPAGSAVYVAPLTAMLLTGATGLFLARRARREGERDV